MIACNNDIHCATLTNRQLVLICAQRKLAFQRRADRAANANAAAAAANSLGRHSTRSIISATTKAARADAANQRPPTWPGRRVRRRWWPHPAAAAAV